MRWVQLIGIAQGRENMEYDLPGYLGEYPLKLDIGHYTDGLKNTLQGILGLKSGQKVVIVTGYVTPDDIASVDSNELHFRRETYTMARFLETAAKLFGYKVIFLEYPATLQNAKEPPLDIAEQILHHADEETVMIFMPWDSLTHTEVRKKACERGARVMSSPHFTAEMMENDGPMCADYTETRKTSTAVAKLIEEAEYDTILCPKGTNIRVYFVEGASAVVDPRDLSVLSDDPLERYGNFPAGEAFRAIKPHPECEGSIVGYLNGEEVKIKIEEGHAVEVLSNNKTSDKVRESLFGDSSEVFKKRRQLGEDGTGTNEFLAQFPERWLYSTLTAEKIWGTKHLALGNNTGFGGHNDADYHQDFIIFEPTAELSTGVRYIEKGELRT